ncbi:MAG: hypothetical protein ABR529_15715 [Actinomycetota bacterium]
MSDVDDWPFTDILVGIRIRFSPGETREAELQFAGGGSFYASFEEVGDLLRELAGAFEQLEERGYLGSDRQTGSPLVWASEDGGVRLESIVPLIGRG